MFRWSGGSVTKDTGCIYHKGLWYARDRRTELTNYKTKSVFWCGKRVGFVTAEVDASLKNVEEEEPPLDRWRDLQFCSDPKEPGLSRIINAGESYLAGTGAGWITSLGLGSYDEGESYHLPKATGLGGDVPTLIAIMAFSCRAQDLEDMFIKDRAWRRGQWKGHKRTPGSESCNCQQPRNPIPNPDLGSRERGLVVNVYLDPDNPDGSTPVWLKFLEYSYGQILLR